MLPETCDINNSVFQVLRWLFLLLKRSKMIIDHYAGFLTAALHQLRPLFLYIDPLS